MQLLLKTAKVDDDVVTWLMDVKGMETVYDFLGYFYQEGVTRMKFRRCWTPRRSL